MREVVDLRVPERNAVRHLPDEVGERLSDTVRRVLVSTDAPLFAEIGRLQKAYRQRGDFFFLGWQIRRYYKRGDLTVAQLLHVQPKKTFEPAGEECGTIYDETSECDCILARSSGYEISGHWIPPSSDTCGAGARQVTPLFLDGRRIPRKQDFARTIAGEIVISARAVDTFQKKCLSGVEFDAVRLSNKDGASSQDHYQLKVIGPPVELHPATRAGSDPFDETSYGRCPRGHIVGLNLLSDVTIRKESLVDADVMVTRQLVGVRRGLLRPQPILLLSPKAWRTIDDSGLKGLVIEVAHLS